MELIAPAEGFFGTSRFSLQPERGRRDAGGRQLQKTAPAERSDESRLLW
jgi:hypothetical protein